MCGICGIYRFDQVTVKPEILGQMNQQMFHRGPDDEGYSVRNHVGIAMRRLSIIDLQKGHQPIANEDKSIEVVLNGEIYNYIELKEKLDIRGHLFKTSSDTEVLVHLYEEYGNKTVDYLNGMYAFAIWDKTQDSLWIARDRIGIKPLYYYIDRKLFAFASNLSALLTLLSSNRRIDRDAFFDYLCNAYVPGPRSIVENIKKLGAGSWIKINREGIEHYRYWKVSSDVLIKVNDSEVVENLLILLKDAIRLQMRSDVPIGTFLSGGVDSSAVVALLSEQSSEPVRTFSVDFNGKKPSELPFARAVAEKFGTLHHEVLIQPETVGDTFHRMLFAMDEPISDSAIIPSFLLSKFARKHGVKVILNGTGGDEIFGGYYRYAFNKKTYLERIQIIPVEVRQYLSKFFSCIDFDKAYRGIFPELHYASSISGINFAFYSKIFKRREDFEELVSRCLKYYHIDNNMRSPRPKMIHDLEHYLEGDILALLDKTSMAVSLEGRVPLLDHRIVEYAFSLSDDLLFLKGELKGLFKLLLKDILPQSVLDRSKMGFNAPVPYWIGSGLLEDVTNIQNNANEFFEDLFDMDELSKITKLSHDSNLRKNAESIFALHVFNEWYHHHIG